MADQRIVTQALIEADVDAGSATERIVTQVILEVDVGYAPASALSPRMGVVLFSGGNVTMV